MRGPSLNDLSVAIEAVPAAVRLADGAWKVTWTIENQSSSVLWLQELRIPHDQFRASDVTFDPPIGIQAGDVGAIESMVAYAEPPGSTLTYPFIIIRARWQGIPCRLFARLRVEADDLGIPRPICEDISVRPLPFER